MVEIEHDMSQGKSEFGSGIVVCLAKFSEHLMNDFFFRIRDVRIWHEMDEEERKREIRESIDFPKGDAARRMRNITYAESIEDIYGSQEKVLSNMIAMWMNGASDHFYDLDETAPQPVKDLASLALKIGHGFTDETWTWEHVEEIRRLWEEACLAVDEQLGVQADWGEW